VLLFLFAVIVISFSKKKTEFLLAAALFITVAVLFKTDFFGGIRSWPFVS
jgi:hypothetical protein